MLNLVLYSGAFSSLLLGYFFTIIIILTNLLNGEMYVLPSVYSLFHHISNILSSFRKSFSRRFENDANS